MNKSIFREVKEDEDVTDIIAKLFALIAILAAAFVIILSLWAIFMTSGNACRTGIC